MDLTEFRLSDDMMISYYGEISVGADKDSA